MGLETRHVTRLEPCQYCPPIGIARIVLSLSPCILLFVVVVEGCGGTMMWHTSMRQNRRVDVAYLRPYVNIS